MFHKTWRDLKISEFDLVQTLWGSGLVRGSWNLYPNWEVEVRTFKENTNVCFSPWERGAKILWFNMAREEYQALVEL